MRISINHKGDVDVDFKQYCIVCDKPLDESKAVIVPGATPEEQWAAEVILYARYIPEEEFGDLRFWCGDCWRAQIAREAEAEAEDEIFDTDRPK